MVLQHDLTRSRKKFKASVVVSTMYVEFNEGVYNNDDDEMDGWMDR